MRCQVGLSIIFFIMIDIILYDYTILSGHPVLGVFASPSWTHFELL